MGITGSFIFVNTQTLIVESFHEERGKALGIWFTAFPFSILVAALAFSPLANTYGWRFPYYSSGLFGLAVAFVLWRMLEEPNSEKRVSGHSGSFAPIVRNTLINKLALVPFLTIQIIGFISFLPTFLVNEYKLNLVWAGLLWSLTPIAQIIGSVASGFLCDLYEKKRMIVIATGLSTLALFLLYTLANFLFPVLFIFVFVIIADRIVELSTTTYAANLSKPGQTGKLMSYINTIGISAMGISTLSLGIMVDNFGYSSVFIFMGLAMLLSSLIAFTIPAENKNAEHSCS